MDDITSEITNANRIEWAKAAVIAFNSANGEALTLEDTIVDLVTDLLHLASIDNLDPQAILIRAMNHYEAEKQGV